MGGYSNPFDQPLSSEVQESQQRQAVSQKASPSGNPFDEPLASEVAEQKHAEAVAPKKQSYFQQALHPEGDIQNPMQPAEAFGLAHPEQQGKLLGAAAIGAGGSALAEGVPALYEMAVKHLAGNVLPGMEESAAHAKLLELAPKVRQAAKLFGGSLGVEGLAKLWEAVKPSKTK